MAFPQSILITGASSGIGRELALSYAARGVHLALSGRNRTRLEDVAAECRTGGAIVATRVLDVRAAAEMAEWIQATDQDRPIDLAIAGAGITGGLGFGRLQESHDDVRRIIETNLSGVLNTIIPTAARMSTRRRGHIAVLGSIAGVQALPYCPAYCASKTAVHTYAEALRGTLRSRGIRITVIMPGFVDTPLSRSIIAPKPLLITTSRAVRVIRRGLDRGAARIVFPRPLYYGVRLAQLLPRQWLDFFLRRIEVDLPETFEREPE